MRSTIIFLLFISLSFLSNAQEEYLSTIKGEFDYWDNQTVVDIFTDEVWDDDDFLGGGGGGSDGQAGYPAHPRRTLQDTFSKSKVESFTARVRAAFLGSEISLGPSITFSRRYIVNTIFMAHGNENIIVRKDGANIFNHRQGRRVVFFCNVAAEASHSLRGSARLSFFGTGARIESGDWNQLSIAQTSKLAYVPFTRSNRPVVLEDLTGYCKETFYQRVKGAVDRELRSVVEGLVYQNTQTECMEDHHCNDWYRVRRGNCHETVARCIEMRNQGNIYNACQMLGTRGASCSIYDENGRRLTLGMFEYECDEGLTCTVTRKGNWFRAWKAECR